MFVIFFNIINLEWIRTDSLSVTELIVHPPVNAVFTNEYIELYNSGAQVISLEDYTLQVANTAILLGNY